LVLQLSGWSALPPQDGWTTLEGTEKEFYALIMMSFRLAVEDARKTIVLKDPTLHP